VSRPARSSSAAEAVIAVEVIGAMDTPANATLWRRPAIGDPTDTLDSHAPLPGSSVAERAAHGQGQPLGETQGCYWVNCRET